MMYVFSAFVEVQPLRFLLYLRLDGCTSVVYVDVLVEIIEERERDSFRFEFPEKIEGYGVEFVNVCMNATFLSSTLVVKSKNLQTQSVVNFLSSLQQLAIQLPSYLN